MTVDWIRQGLKHTGKTRSGLARALGRSPSAVTDLLNGHRRLRADEIAIVAEYLGIEPPRLVGGGSGTSGGGSRCSRRRALRWRKQARAAAIRAVSTFSGLRRPPECAVIADDPLVDRGHAPVGFVLALFIV